MVPLWRLNLVDQNLWARTFGGIRDVGVSPLTCAAGATRQWASMSVNIGPGAGSFQ